MTVPRVSCCFAALAVPLILALVFPASLAQAPAPAPAVSDGASIDQGIAYVLMLLALALTYLIHAADLS